MRETAFTTLHAKRVLAEGTNSEIEMGQAEESTLNIRGRLPHSMQCQIPTDIIWKSLYSHGTSGLGC